MKRQFAPFVVTGDAPKSSDSIDWAEATPSYMQSTIDLTLCQSWDEAITNAEREAAARRRELLGEVERTEQGTQSRAQAIWQAVRCVRCQGLSAWVAHSTAMASPPPPRAPFLRGSQELRL